MRNFIEYLNSGDEKKANQLLSNDFDKESILLKEIETDNGRKIKKMILKKNV